LNQRKNAFVRPLPKSLSQGEGVRKIDVSNLPAGAYFIKIGDTFEKFI
jgi:hypothetical protein